MFDQLVFHERSHRLIEKISGNLPHALVIDGVVGVGVVELAKVLSRSMNSPEIIIKPKKSQNGQMVIDEKEGNIIIEDIRQLYEQTRTKQPFAQVFILDTGERAMTVAAQNAFLKLLEEPHPGLHFIIATHQPDQLLPTIFSRAQRLSLLPITPEQSSKLVESLDIKDATKKARLVFVTQGRPALMKRLANDDSAYDARVQIMSDAKTMISGTPYEKLQVVHKYRDNRSGAVTLIDDMNHQLNTVVKGRPDQRLVGDIAKNLAIRQKIIAGGNIRLQLAGGVL